MRRLRRDAALALVLALAPGSVAAAPQGSLPRPGPDAAQSRPTYVERVRPALVGLSVRADPAAPSSARLGAERQGTAVVFDSRGYAVTVAYVVLDAVAIEARTAAGRTVPGRLVGVDFESGLAVVALAGGPWPAVPLARSSDLVPGALTAAVGIDAAGNLAWTVGRLRGIQRFAGSWEWMLDRALIVAPSPPSWSGNALVTARGDVVGIVSLRLGAPPHVNVAIPVDLLAPVTDELIAAGVIASRPARPWLGVYTADTGDGLVVTEVAAAGPAARAELRRGDRIRAVDGEPVASQEEFYERLWTRRAGDVIRLSLERGGRPVDLQVASTARRLVGRAGAR